MNEALYPFWKKKIVTAAKTSKSRGWTPQNAIGGETPNFWVKKDTRSGIDLVDAISGNNPKILPAVGKIDNANFALRTVANFGNIASGYVECKFYYVTGSVLYLFSSADTASSIRYIYCYISPGGKPGIAARNALTFTDVYIATDPIAQGWHTVRFASSGTAYTITVDGTAVAGGAVVGADNGNWFADIPLRDNIGMGLLQAVVQTLSTNTQYISYIDFNGTNVWYLTGAGKYIYDIVGAAHMTWSGAAHIAYDVGGSQQLLNVGYTLYTKESEPDEYVPYISEGTPYDASALLVGYAATLKPPKDLINLAPALIDFDPAGTTPAGVANYDLSNVTQWSDLARAWDFYDATHPYRIPLEVVFDPVVYYNWRNVNYERMLFCGGDRVGAVPLSLAEILSYPTNKSVSDADKINTYLGR